VSIEPGCAMNVPQTLGQVGGADRIICDVIQDVGVRMASLPSTILRGIDVVTVKAFATNATRACCASSYTCEDDRRSRRNAVSRRENNVTYCHGCARWSHAASRIKNRADAGWDGIRAAF
jgi:hypothetical protein